MKSKQLKLAVAEAENNKCAEPVIAPDYEELYQRLLDEFNEYRENEERRLMCVREEACKIHEMHEEEFRKRIKELESDLKFKEEIIKSVLHIR